VIILCFIFSRFDESTGKICKGNRTKAPAEPEVCDVNKQEEQMGIFQILDALGEAADVLLNTSFYLCKGMFFQFAQHHLTIQTLRKAQMKAHTGEKPYS
jgi:hypothetical protein